MSELLSSQDIDQITLLLGEPSTNDIWDNKTPKLTWIHQGVSFFVHYNADDSYLSYFSPFIDKSLYSISAPWRKLECPEIFTEMVIAMKCKNFVKLIELCIGNTVYWSYLSNCDSSIQYQENGNIWGFDRYYNKLTFSSNKPSDIFNHAGQLVVDDNEARQEVERRNCMPETKSQ